MKNRILRIITILLVLSMLTESGSFKASSFDTLDADSAVAGASLALKKYFSANENAAVALTEILEKVAEANQEVDVEDNNGKVTNSYTLYEEPLSGTVCTEGTLNIRQDTSALSDVIGKAYEGGDITALGEVSQNGILWYQVSFEGVTGYALGRYILFGADVDAYFLEVHERKKAEAVMPEEYKITEDISSLNEGAQENITSRAKEVNYCLKVEYPKAVEEESYLNQYSIIVYILENLQGIEDYALAFEVTELYDRTCAVVETINLIREKLTDTTGISDTEYDAEIQRKAEERLKNSESYQGSQIALYAATFIGWLPYIWGGASLTDGADCSGFCQQIYAHFGLFDQSQANAHAYDSWRLRTIGREVSRDEILPGDMVCYNGHVAIYYGDNLVVHEPSPGKMCSYGNIDMMPIVTIRRLVTAK